MTADLNEVLRALEVELLEQEVRHDEAHLRQLLADEFIEFGSSGRIYDKQSVIDTLLNSAATETFRIDDFKLLVSGDDTAFVTYSCVARSDSGDIVRKSNRSSLWRKNDGRWQMLFHQGTRTE